MEESLFMSITFAESETKKNLMRAFACESQTRNCYTFVAEQAKALDMYVLEMLFRYTAEQEKEHAEIFYRFLKEASGESMIVDGAYPIELEDNLLALLRDAQKREYEEHDTIYKEFGDVALQEGYSEIAFAFHQIARVEKIHGDRFGKYADLLEQGKLFVADHALKWNCLNCGAVFDSKEAPEKCPVCRHGRGYFIRRTAAPFDECEF